MVDDGVGGENNKYAGGEDLMVSFLLDALHNPFQSLVKSVNGIPIFFKRPIYIYIE